MRRPMATMLTVSTVTLLFSAAVWAYGNPLGFEQPQKNANKPPSQQVKQGVTAEERALRVTVQLAAEVRHQLVMLPYYNVFDWLGGEVTADGKVVLKGQVVRPVLKADAESSVKKIEGVRSVENQIEVLPNSPNDDRLRMAVHRAIYNFDSPLFSKYAVRSVPPIHIIVKNGHVVLKGVVDSKMDSQLANMAANGVSGVFDVKNELMIEESAVKK